MWLDERVLRTSLEKKFLEKKSGNRCDARLYKLIRSRETRPILECQISVWHHKEVMPNAVEQMNR